MGQALELAAHARAVGEVPIGALLCQDGAVVARGWNQPVGAHDPTAHAEIIALRAAARLAGNYRLNGTTLYVTLEPCVMCIGAILTARVGQLVFGAWDKKFGACGSVFDIPRGARPLFKLDVLGGVRDTECAALLQQFFLERRGQRGA